MFSLQEAFLMNASQSQVIGLKTLQITFRKKKKCGSKFWQIFCEFFFIFAYDQTVTISSRLIFAFAIFALFNSTVLMVWKEELFMISPKFQ